MNILFCTAWPIKAYLGGVERVTDILSRGLIEKGHNVYCFCLDKQGNDDDYQFVAPQFYGHLSSLESDYLDIINKYTIDCVVFQNTVYWFKQAMAVTPERVRVLWAYHTAPFPTLFKERHVYRMSRPKSLWKKIYRLICIACPLQYRVRSTLIYKRELESYASLSDYSIFLSQRFLPIVRKRTSIPEQKLTFITNPITFNINNNVDLKDKKQLILLVGRQHNQSKNIVDFIKMWSIIERRNPSWYAEVYGNGPDLDYNKTLVKTLGLKRISFNGYCDNIGSRYKEASFVCSTSFYEGYGMTLAEAASWGCVPVAFDTSEAFKDIIHDGDTGLLIEPFNYKLMAVAIQDLINNPVKLKSMQKRVINGILNLPNNKEIISQWESLF